jgi:hypothetical protein
VATTAEDLFLRLETVDNRDVLPDYWVERPPMRLSPSTRAAVEELLSVVDEVPNRLLDVSVLLQHYGDIDVWKLLVGVADRRRIAFHGTGDPGIESFEPRRPVDFAPFGDQQAVFATSDPIWAMFYAIVDRDRYDTTLNNGCIVVFDSRGHAGTPYYYFSVGRRALQERPWRSGYVYFMPADTFVEQAAGEYAGLSSQVPQLASPVPVAPFARIRVTPGDFPFLAQIRGHEDERLAEYAQAVMTAAPWPD